MMPAATGRPQLTAATEHSPCTSARVVFINIDWKASRHSSDKAFKRNMQTLGHTIGGVVRNMRPTMICMCEVGEATRALSSKEMKQVADRCMLSWQDAATEHARNPTTTQPRLRGILATRVCYRATLASTCKTSSNPRASNDSTPRRGHAAWSVICWVCYRATLASFSCCSPSA